MSNSLAKIRITDEPNTNDAKTLPEQVAPPPKPKPSFSPRFVKANINFEMDGMWHHAGEHLINSSGVPGFAWGVFDPIKMVGKPTRVSIQVRCEPAYQFQANAFFTCEQTSNAKYLGLAFALEIREATTLNAIVSQDGILPDFVRKFPRIHYLDRIKVMPKRAILKFFEGGADIPMVCDLDNISPTGLQVFSEDARMLSLQLNETLRIQLQPRGDFAFPVSMNTILKRLIHSVDPETGNRRWYLGLGITSISEDQKVFYAELLRLIVTQARL